MTRTLTKLAGTFALCTALVLGLSGCGGDENEPNNQKPTQEEQRDPRLSEPLEITEDISLITITDNDFTCDITLNTSWRNVAAGIDCDLTDGVDPRTIRSETIKLDDDIEFRIINNDGTPKFLTVNTSWRNVSAPISVPQR